MPFSLIAPINWVHRRDSHAIAVLCLIGATLAVPYTAFGPNFITDDWYSLSNAHFDGIWAAGGEDQKIARPGAWLTYAVVFGFSSSPLGIFLVQAVLSTAVGVALYVGLRKALPVGPAFAISGIWSLLPNHTSLLVWASCINITVSLLLVLIGGTRYLDDVSHRRTAWISASALGASVLFYEAVLPFAALLVCLAPLRLRVRPTWRSTGLAISALSASVIWVTTHWHPAKPIQPWVDVSLVLPAHFGEGIVAHPVVAVLMSVIATIAMCLVVVRTWRRRAIQGAEGLFLIGLGIIVVGTLPYLRYRFGPIGLGDRANVIAGIGTAICWTAILTMIPSRAIRTAAAALAIIVWTSTFVYRMQLYAEQGRDVIRARDALATAYPTPPAGAVAIYPCSSRPEGIRGSHYLAISLGAWALLENDRRFQTKTVCDQSELESYPPERRYDWTKDPLAPQLPLQDN